MFLQQKDERQLWLLLYVLWLVPAAFSGIWLIYFKSAGIADHDILLSFLAWPLSAITTILFFNFVPAVSRNLLLLLGILSAAMSFFIIPLFPPSPLLLATSFFFYGFPVFLFWVPFNIRYFGFAGDSGAVSSAIYFSVGGLLSLLLAVIGGAVFEFLNPQAFFFSAALLHVFPALVLMRIKDEKYMHNIVGCLSESKGFRTLSFIDGTSTGVLVAGTIISLFYFADRPFFLSLFLAFVTFFSIVASFVISRLSDKTKKRKRYVLSFGVLFGFVTAAMGLAWDLVSWVGLSALRNFFSTLFFPFTTAIIIDNKRDLSKLMVGREVFLNLGRVFGIGAAVLSQVFFLDVRPSLILLGIVVLVYPLVLHLKKAHVFIQ